MSPAYLAENQKIVFVGFNPGKYPDSIGGNIARTTNLFWTALNASGLVSERSAPENDHCLLQFGPGSIDIGQGHTQNSI
jgi:double-stranded uracil-DNA glycosylase